MKHNKQLFTYEALSEFCRQLAMLLKAGIALSQGLELLREDSESEAEAALLQNLEDAYLSGGSLAGAMESTGAYPGYLLRMVRLGEEAGRLDDVLAGLADHYSREQSLRRSIRGAIVYPAMMLGMVLVIIGVLLTQVMPVFDQVFAQLGTRLTGLSRLLMDMGQGIREYSLVLAALLVVLVLGAVWLRRSPKTAYRLIRGIPWSRNLCEKISLCRFAGALSMSLGSGLDTQHALELASELTNDPDFSRRVAAVRDQVSEGAEITQALRDNTILTGSHNRLALVGQKTGSLDGALAQIADACQEEADRAVASAVSLIEPVLVIVLSVLVGILLLSVLFPLLGILATI